MMTRFLKLLLLSFCFAGSLCHAERVRFFSAADQTNLTSDGTPMGRDFVFELGVFANGFVPTLSNTAQWAANWRPAKAADGTKALDFYNPNTRRFDAEFTVTDNTSPFTVGATGYVWGFQAGAAVSEWILFRRSTWNWPAPDPFDPTPLDWNVAKATPVVGEINAAGSPFLMQSASVANAASPATPVTLKWVYNNDTAVPVKSSGYSALGNASLKLNFTPSVGTNLTVVKNTSLDFINGTFINLVQGQKLALTYNGVTYNFIANYHGGSGNDLVLQWADVRPMAWGNNGNGELGDNSNTVLSTIPVPVSTTSGALVGKTVLAMTAGLSHSLALCSDGTLATWGGNTSGQLGDDTLTENHLPVKPMGILTRRKVIAVAAGGLHNLALRADGTLASWGDNTKGQLGNKTNTASKVPVAVNTQGVLAGKTIIAIAAGNAHSLALCSDGTLAAWGDNTKGQLGNNSNTSRNVPVAVNTQGVLAGKTIIAVAAGKNHSLALCSDGTLAAWGDNSKGQLGNNSTTNSNVPVAVFKNGILAGKRLTHIAAGGMHNLALAADGSLVAWGSNTSGQLGNNSTLASKVPVYVITSGVLSGKTIVSLAAGAYHSAALSSDGTLASWGADSKGQLGIKSITLKKVPAPVNSSSLASGERFVLIGSGSSATHSLALIASPPAPAVTTLAAASSLPQADTTATVSEPLADSTVSSTSLTSESSGSISTSLLAPLAISTLPEKTIRGYDLIDGHKYLTLTVIKTPGTYARRIVEVSPDFLDWFSGRDYTTVIQNNASLLKVRDNTPVTLNAKRYIRLKSSTVSSAP